MAAVAAAAVASAQATLPPGIHGRVLDAHSLAPIAGARINVGETSATSDATGRFMVPLTAGTWTVDVSASGYLPDRVEVTVATSNVEVELLLVSQSQFREQVTVTGAPGYATDAPPALPVSPLEVRSVAGAAENVFRVLQTLPGVAAADDFGSRLSVRGGGPDQNLTVMDGVEIYNPYRLFGLTSAFNPETVENFELTAGGFGAKYGDRLSSLLLIENRAGTADRTATGSFALGLTDTNVILEGRLPGGAKGSWLATGRRTYYDLVAERFTDQDLPSFEDVQVKTVWEPKGTRVTLFGLRSREKADAEFTRAASGEHIGFDSTVRNDVAAASWLAPIGSRISSRTIASWYVNADVLGVDANVRNDARISNAAGAEHPLIDIAFTRGLSVRDVAVREELAARASPAHVVETGFELHALRTSVLWTITGERSLGEANGSSVRGGAGLPSALDSSRRAMRAGAWLQDRWDARRVTLESGLRLDWSGINGEFALAPRIAATWPLPRGARARAAGGLYTQSPGYEKLIQSDYFVDLTDASRLDLRSERAVHAIAGIERDLRPGLLARVEGFYRGYSRAIVGRLETPAEAAARVAAYDYPADLAGSVPVTPQITSNPVNGASGRAYGFDAFVSRRSTSAATRLTGWASYTYGRADIDAYGRRYPFDYDRPHALSVVGTYRVRRSLDVAATLRVASGFPTTLPVGLRVPGAQDTSDADGDGNTTELRPRRDETGALLYEPDLGGVDNLNRDRLPVFARLDGRVTWRKSRWQIYLEVINVLNRDNAGDLAPKLEPDPSSDRPRITYVREGGFPRLPSLGLRVRF
jgi:carboxypeptidase family protein/TonB-dependent receptor-like protein